jgi:hypothetical protein
MRSRPHVPGVLALGLALAALATGGVVHAQKPTTTIEVQPREGTKVIALQVWAENLTTGAEARYGIAPTNEAVPVAPGDRVRLRLVGTSINAEGKGVSVPIEARIGEAPGTRRLEVLERGANWIVVRVGERDTGRSDDLAQLAFEVTGRYDLRPTMTQGRITLDLGARVVAPSPSERRQAAEELATLLYRGILRVDPQAVRLVSGYEQAVDQIERRGYPGLVDLARELARQVELDALRSRTARPAATAVVGHLYRVLLGRSGSDQELAASDPGFAGNVRRYESGGMVDVVEVIVNSAEFAQVQRLDRIGWAPAVG